MRCSKSKESCNFAHVMTRWVAQPKHAPPRRNPGGRAYWRPSYHQRGSMTKATIPAGPDSVASTARPEQSSKTGNASLPSTSSPKQRPRESSNASAKQGKRGIQVPSANEEDGFLASDSQTAKSLESSTNETSIFARIKTTQGGMVTLRIAASDGSKETFHAVIRRLGSEAAELLKRHMNTSGHLRVSLQPVARFVLGVCCLESDRTLTLCS